MLIWNASCGYAPRYPTKLSDINFLDNGKVCIPTYKDISVINGKKGSYTEIYDTLYSIIGTQANQYYSNPVHPSNINYYFNQLNSMLKIVPSIGATFPNSFSYFTTVSTNNECYVYIPSISRVMSYGENFVRIANVDSDGSISSFTNSGADIFGHFYPQTSLGGYLRKCVLLDGSDITDITNYYVIDITCDTSDPSNNWIYVNGPLVGNSSTLVPYFGASETPDEVLPFPPTNPYAPANPSAPGDTAPGTFDDTSDSIPWSPLPTLSAADTGFTRIYNPTLSQVQDLARYLWTEDNLIGTLWNKIKQFFEDPMQSFIAFNLVPCPVPDGGTEEFTLLFIPTGVTLTTAANQFVDVDCGTCEVKRYYGSALDQTPYTKISCFLPYIGIVALDTDEIMGTTLQIKYRIDIVSGSCVAGILVDGNLLYQYSGHCAITIPLASADFSRYVQAAIAVASGVAGGLVPGAGGALSGLMGLAQDAEQQTDYVVTKYYDKTETVRNPETGRQITASGVHTTTRTVYPAEQTSTKASFAGITPSNIANTVGEVMSAKAAIQHSGSFSGNSGYLGLRRPYLLITRPRMCLPENYQALNGYPSMITMTLGDCQGYTRVQQVQLTGMHATNPEQAEILELLKSGVIF